MDKVLELAKKIKALAEQGVGGEKDNAQKILDKYLKQNGLTYKDLEESEIEDFHFFSYKGEIERRLLNQIIYAVHPNREYYKPDKRKKDTQLIIRATLIQATEIRISFEHYCKSYKEQEDIFYAAFVNKHNIFPKEEAVNTPQKNVDLKRLEQIRRMMGVIKFTPNQKRLK